MKLRSSLHPQAVPSPESVDEMCIRDSNYTNKEGKKVYTTDVIVDDQEFADSKGAASNGNQSQDRPVPTNAVGDGFMNIPDLSLIHI